MRPMSTEIETPRGGLEREAESREPASWLDRHGGATPQRVFREAGDRAGTILSAAARDEDPPRPQVFRALSSLHLDLARWREMKVAGARAAKRETRGRT